MKRKCALNDAFSRLRHLHYDLSEHGARCLIIALEGIMETYQEIRAMEALNDTRIFRGKELLQTECNLLNESNIDEDTGRDAICDILHGMIAEGFIKGEDIQDVCIAAGANVTAELEDEGQ
jgi:hypothetical protein